jgi:sarcosine oxidase subunit alpha
MASEDDGRGLAPAEPRGRPLTVDFEGRSVRAFEGEPLGVALFADGERVLGRSTKYHRPRGLFCLEGHCGSCLLRIDGRPNRRACLEPVREGLRCERQNAFPDADVDLLRAADWLFPKGMDHHRMMTGSRVGNEIFLKLVRQMGGSGLLPDAPVAELPPVRDERVDLCVVGAGPSGLSAARAAAQAHPGARILLVDEQDQPGGSLLAEPGGVARARRLTDQAVRAGVRLWSRARAIAFYPEDQPAVLAVVTEAGLVRLEARRHLYATGAYDQNLPFPDSDRAGVLSARGCGRLVFRWGVRPGRRVVLVSAESSAYGALLTRGLRELGIEVQTAALDAVPAVDLRRDVIAVDALPAPASELARQHGARVVLRAAAGGFAVETDEEGRTSVAQVRACGDVTGYQGPEAAAAHGVRVGARVDL